MISLRVLVRVLAVTALAVVGVIAMGLSTAGSGSHTAPATADTMQPAAAPVAWSLPPHIPARAVLIGRVSVPIRTSAGWVRPTTPLGSDTWLLILRHHGRHGVALIPTAGAPRTAPIDLAELDLRWTRVRVDVNLSRLRLSVLRGRRLLGSFSIAAGTPASPTPTGRFSVTDRVTFPPGSPYGRFALGLSAHQSQPLVGWHGGNQIAIHGTSHPDSIGSYASLGCIRVPQPALRLLERIVPLGAPVTVRS